MPLFKLSFGAFGLEAGGAASNVLTGLAEPRALAVTLFEDGAARFLVEAYFETEPSLGAVAEATPGRVATLAKRCWKPCPTRTGWRCRRRRCRPIAAGRFLVHGRHDRARAGARRTANRDRGRRGLRHGPQRHDRAVPRGHRSPDAAAPLRASARSGCGTGVLAIAAARVLPGARVLAVDNDPLATAIARANERLNGVGRCVRVLDASGFAHPLLRPAGAFDLVLANLLPGPLIALAPAMRRALRPGGIAVLSGLLDHQAREVGAQLLRVGLSSAGSQPSRGLDRADACACGRSSTVIPAGARMRSLPSKLLKRLAAAGYTVDIKPPAQPTSQLSLASAKASASGMTGGHDEAEAACYGVRGQLQHESAAMQDLKSLIRTIPDYPKKGIMFRDVTTLLGNAQGFKAAIEQMAAPYAGAQVQAVAGIEARGFILGGAIADRLGCGFVPLRKKGKLPWKTIGQEYTLEYGVDIIEMHEDAIRRGERILIVDDLIATGGTAEAAVKLLKRSGGEIVGATFIIDLPELGGMRKLAALGIKSHVLMAFEGH